MSAAGLALIAGGLAVLIGFRHVLLGRDLTDAVTDGRLGERSVRRRPARADFSAPGQIRARRRRQSLATVPATVAPAAPVATVATGAPEAPAAEDGDSGLIALGLVTPEDPPDEPAGDRADADEPATGTLAALGVEPPEDPEPTPAPRREGDRVQDWVRPKYDDEPPAGEYWTPIPETLHSGYGWPVPVERLPEVPPYPPQSGFDLGPFDEDADVVAEPTKVVPQWPPAKPSGRIELPRSWAARNSQSRSGEEGEPDRPRRRSPVRRIPAPDAQNLPAATDAEQPRRPRPRPRPAPADRSNVYRSRHAADPS